MIETVIYNYLKATLSVPVFTERPDLSQHANFVLFEKTGSGRSNKLPSSTIAFQSWGESLYKATVINDEVKMAVDNMITLDEIGSVRLNSDYPFNDPSTKKHRYQAVYDISHY